MGKTKGAERTERYVNVGVGWVEAERKQKVGYFLISIVWNMPLRDERYREMNWAR